LSACLFEITFFFLFLISKKKKTICFYQINHLYPLPTCDQPRGGPGLLCRGCAAQAAHGAADDGRLAARCPAAGPRHRVRRPRVPRDRGLGRRRRRGERPARLRGVHAVHVRARHCRSRDAGVRVPRDDLPARSGGAAGVLCRARRGPRGPVCARQGRAQRGRRAQFECRWGGIGSCLYCFFFFPTFFWLQKVRTQ
jgi:hypothetical protein